MDKREAILRAGIKTFAERGYFHSKVANIAAEAGVADGTVYLYFKNKDDILPLSSLIVRCTSSLRRAVANSQR